MKNKSVESLRLFDNDLLEALTHVHPALPAIVWSPIVVYLYYYGIEIKGLPLSEVAIVSFVGLLVWTFTEYALHRWAFHFPAKSKFGKRIVFLFHGNHHDVPNDKTRLVFPPVPAMIIMFFLWQFFALIVPARFIEVFMGSFTVGYLCYDYIHYATHHFPMTSKVGKYLRKYHLQHHYQGRAAKYGVSNPLWDYIFQTVEGPLKKKVD
tara:strand:+ start:174 stop:797 length:624 start_codon:yes stop_codon:yes gene_type:complete